MSSSAVFPFGGLTAMIFCDVCFSNSSILIVAVTFSVAIFDNNNCPSACVMATTGIEAIFPPKLGEGGTSPSVLSRSEERRVGKESRWRGLTVEYKKEKTRKHLVVGDVCGWRSGSGYGRRESVE